MGLRAGRHALLDATLAGQRTPCPPVSLWRHFPELDQDPRSLAAATVAWQRAHDFDFVKFMPSGTYGVEDWGVRTAYRGAPYGNRVSLGPAFETARGWADLPRLDPCRGVLGQQNDALHLTSLELGGSVPILQTLFSPMTTALKLVGDALWAHLRQDPQAVLAGLDMITEVTIAFARQALAAGAQGFFFASQTANRAQLEDADYLLFCEAHDLRVLQAVASQARYVVVHLHGEDVRFERAAHALPCNLISWHDRHTRPSLAEAREITDKTLVCGLEWTEGLGQRRHDELAAQIDDAVAASGGLRWVLAPGCVCPVDMPLQASQFIVEHVRVAQ